MFGHRGMIAILLLLLLSLAFKECRSKVTKRSAGGNYGDYQKNDKEDDKEGDDKNGDDEDDEDDEDDKDDDDKDHSYGKNKVESLKRLKKYLDSIDVKNQTQVQDIINSFTHVLSKDTQTDQIKEDIMALKLMENIGKKMAVQLKPTKEKPATVGAAAGDQAFGVATVNQSKLSGFSFPDHIENIGNSSTFGARIDLPCSVLAASGSRNVSLVFMIYNPSSEMKARTGDHPENVNMSKKVVLASIFPQPKFLLTKPVVITIQQPMLFSNTTLKPTCAFLIEDQSGVERFGIWSTKGCQLAYYNETHSTCHCYHLTNFAILLQFSKTKLPEEHGMALNVITYVGLSLSIVGCFLTFIAHLLLPKLWIERGFIHMNLVASLGIANIVFLFETVPDKNSIGCTAVAIILFYFYLAAFSWMLLEGFHIYRLLIKVFQSGKDPRKAFFLAGWGMPLVIVGISASVYRRNITSEYYCWLSMKNGALWTFAAPVCLVILINTVMLIVVLKTSLDHSHRDKRLRRSMARTLCILLPVLGLTWVFGIISFNRNILVFQYIFAILNSLQGFTIFVFYCLYNSEVKREISQKISIWRTEHEIEKAQSTSNSKVKSSENLFNKLTHSPAVQKAQR